MTFLTQGGISCWPRKIEEEKCADDSSYVI